MSNKLVTVRVTGVIVDPKCDKDFNVTNTYYKKEGILFLSHVQFISEEGITDNGETYLRVTLRDNRFVYILGTIESLLEALQGGLG